MKTFKQFLVESAGSSAHLKHVTQAIQDSHPDNWKHDDWDALDSLHASSSKVKRGLPKDHPIHQLIKDFKHDYKDESSDDEGVGAARHLHKALKQHHETLTGVKGSGDKIKSIHYEKPEAKIASIDKALNDKDEYVRGRAASHPKASPEHISKALDDSSVHVRYEAAKNPNASKENIAKASKDNNFGVVSVASKSKHASSEHIHRVLDRHDTPTNKHTYVHRMEAASSLGAKKEHLDRALKDPHDAVRHAAISNPNIDQKHVSKALHSTNFYERAAAAQNPNIGKHDLHKALKDPDSFVRNYAQTNIDHIKKR